MHWAARNQFIFFPSPHSNQFANTEITATAEPHIRFVRQRRDNCVVKKSKHISLESRSFRKKTKNPIERQWRSEENKSNYQSKGGLNTNPISFTSVECDFWSVAWPPLPPLTSYINQLNLILLRNAYRFL